MSAGIYSIPLDICPRCMRRMEMDTPCMCGYIASGQMMEADLDEEDRDAFIEKIEDGLAKKGCEIVLSASGRKDSGA